MSHKTLNSFVVGSSIALLAALTIWSPVQAGPASTAGKMQMTETPMKDHCKDMMEQKKTLAADIKSQDAELTEQVARMNRAPGDKQMTLMAAVITRMVENQVAMDQRRAKMEDAMMAHMTAHMQNRERHPASHVLIIMLRLVNDREVMGEYVNSRRINVVTWATVAILILLTLLLLVTSLLGV